jgi:hypothetical protein
MTAFLPNIKDGSKQRARRLGCNQLSNVLFPLLLRAVPVNLFVHGCGQLRQHHYQPTSERRLLQKKSSLCQQCSAGCTRRLWA